MTTPEPLDDLLEGYTSTGLECPCCGDEGIAGTLYCVECESPWDDSHTFRGCQPGYVFLDGDPAMCGCDTVQVSADGESAYLNDHAELGDPPCKKCGP